VSSAERGSAGLLTAAIAGFVAAMTVALAAVAGVQIGRLRATTAADAAALAAAPVTFLPFGAAGSPAAEAGRFARLNGALLVSCRCDVDPSFEPRSAEVRVRVAVRLPLFGSISVEATGRAEFVPAALLEQL
jgi:secretion/DNA translocation related TadE-like protein